MKSVFRLTAIISFIALFNTLPSLGENYIVVSKQQRKLYVIDNITSDTIFTARVALGKALGNKQREGDNKTPEGTFSISHIQYSPTWRFRRNDGTYTGPGVYGPWFLRLKVPNCTSIGIHGTSSPKSVGTRSSHGCIRLTNKDITTLKQNYAFVGMKVIIEPDIIVKSSSKSSKSTKSTKKAKSSQNTTTTTTSTENATSTQNASNEISTPSTTTTTSEVNTQSSTNEATTTSPQSTTNEAATTPPQSATTTTSEN